MKTTKKWVSVILCFCMLLGMISVCFAVMGASVSFANKVPVIYELYDYYKDVVTGYQNNKSIETDSPFRVEIKSGNNWLPTDEYKKKSRDIIYYGYNKNKVIKYYPGFSFSYPNQISDNDKYYQSFISASNLEGDSDGAFKINTAYTFYTPENGTYDLGKSNQNLIFNNDLCNYFQQYNSDVNLDFGVKITVNNDSIWPKQDDSNIVDGFIKFGTKEAKIKKVEVPEIQDISLKKGDVLRVEFTSFTPVNSDKVASQEISGCFSITGKDFEDEPEEPPIEQKSYFELYDYFENVYTACNENKILHNNSAWNTQFYFDDKWNDVDYFEYRDDGYCYAGCSARSDWNKIYPGFSFFNNRSGTRYKMCKIVPIKTLKNKDFDIDASYVFTAPSKGSYTFNYCNQDTVVSFEDSEYFSMRDQVKTGTKFGVKITLNDKTIWPLSLSYKEVIQDGFATFGYGLSDAPSSIKIPKIDNIGMNQGDELRIVYTAFTGIGDNPWHNAITGNLGMTKTSDDFISDNDAPVFSDGQISVEKTGGNYLILKWPSAHDNLTEDKSLKYELYYSKEPFTNELPVSGKSISVNSTGGAVLNIEGDIEYYFLLAVYDNSYNYSILMGGPFKTSKTENTDNIFEVYGYLDEISSKIASDQQKIEIRDTQSQWISQYYDSDKEWKNINIATRLNDLIYCNTRSPEWGGYYPGMSFLSPIKTKLNYYFARLNPANKSSSDFDYNVAYTFTPIYSGKYTFEKANTENALNEKYGKYFANCDSGSTDQTLGIRITLNDNVIWPLENTDCTIQDTYAVLKGYNNPESMVEIPTINNIKMISGDTLRVEAKAFSSTSKPWTQQVSANVRMVMTEKIIDKDPPVFNSGEIKLTAKTTSSLTVTWPLATDELSNDATIKYQIYYDKNPISKTNIELLEPISVKGTSQRITLLEEKTDYYFAIVVTDISGNSEYKFAGPFKTATSSSSSENSDSSGNIVNITAPLSSNKTADQCGIIASEVGKVTVGWNQNESMSYYMAFLFNKTGDTYKAINNSGKLSSSTNRYTFENIADGSFSVQVIGFNNQGEPFDIFNVLKFINSKNENNSTTGNKDNSGYIDTSESNSEDGYTYTTNTLNPLLTDKVNNITTYVKEDGTTEVQDLYETVNNTKTTVTGPSVIEQILWFSLLIFGGIMLIASGLLLYMLLKKPKKFRLY